MAVGPGLGAGGCSIVSNKGAGVLCCHQTQYVSSTTELLRARTTSLLIGWAVLRDFTALKVSHGWCWEHQRKMWKPSTGRRRKADSSWSQHPHGIGLQALVMPSLQHLSVIIYFSPPRSHLHHLSPDLLHPSSSASISFKFTFILLPVWVPKWKSNSISTLLKTSVT